jgi:hypothetical protein
LIPLGLFVEVKVTVGVRTAGGCCGCCSIGSPFVVAVVVVVVDAVVVVVVGKEGIGVEP